MDKSSFSIWQVYLPIRMVYGFLNVAFLKLDISSKSHQNGFRRKPLVRSLLLEEQSDMGLFRLHIPIRP